MSEKLFYYCAFLSKYIPTGWDFYKSFQLNNELKLVTKTLHLSRNWEYNKGRRKGKLLIKC